MNTFPTLILFLLLGSSLPLGAAILTGPVTNTANGHRYYLLDEDTWQNSEAQAVELGGHLVTINDPAEQDWVFSTFASYAGTNRSLWIGLREVNVGDYQWVSGESVEYTHWLPGQPDNSPVAGGEAYIHMLNTGNEYGHPGGFWNDLASPNAVFLTFNPVCGVVEVLATDLPVLSIRVSPREVCWTTTTNRLYQLQYTTELTAEPWIDLGSPLLGDGSNACVADADVLRQPRRFYRVVVLP